MTEWLVGWGNRVKISLDHNDIDAALSDFPHLIEISASSGYNDEDITFVFDELQNNENRKKIAVTKADGVTQCYVEINNWDHANEEALLWVKIPDVDPDEDTELFLYYDRNHPDNDARVGDPGNAVVHNVWNTNFKLVTHMEDDPGNSHVEDSTVNGNHGTFSGWLGTWKKRILLTIDSSKIDTADLTNFPILIHLSAASGIGGIDSTCVFDEIGADYLKIAVAVGNNECFVEVEKWDEVAEEAWLWVKVPLVHFDRDDTLSLYYGADHADNVAKVGLPNSVVAESVWDAIFKLASHMQDDPDVSNVRDSTSNDNDGAKEAANEPLEDDGLIGKAQKFDGINDDIKVTGIAFGKHSTIEFVFSPRDNAGGGQWGARFDVLSGSFGAGANRFLVYSSTATSLLFLSVSTDATNFSITIDCTGWLADEPHVITLILSDSDNDSVMEVYVDGVLVNSIAYAKVVAAQADLYLGSSNGAANWTAGIYDEVRVSDGVRTAEWIKATNESIRDNLITFGEETGDYGPWLDGIIGKALEFDGESDFVNIPYDVGLAPTDGLTIAVWFKMRNWDSHHQLVNNGYNHGLAEGVRMGFISDRRLRAYYGDGVGASEFIVSDGLMPYDTDVLAVTTYDGTTIRLYVNGVLQADTKPLTTIARNLDATTIGAYGAQRFNGVEDEVRISNIGRSSAWVKARYESETDHLNDFGDPETPTLQTKISTITVDIPARYRYNQYNVDLVGSFDTDEQLHTLRELFARARAKTAVHDIPGSRPRGEDMNEELRNTQYIQFAHGDRPITGWYLLRDFNMFQDETPLGFAYNFAINLFFLGTTAEYSAGFAFKSLEKAISDWGI